MLRKKLIALGLVGITTLGAVASNTVIALAAPTNAETSDNTLKFETLKEKINNSIKTISRSLYYKEYKNVPNHFETLHKDMNKISKCTSIDDINITDLDMISLQYRYISEKIQAEKSNMIKLIISKINDLSKAIREKNTNEALLIKKEIDSNIDKLRELAVVPQFILKEFIYSSNRLDNLISSDKSGTTQDELKSLIHSQFEKLSKAIKEKNIDEAILIRKQIDSNIDKMRELSGISQVSSDLLKIFFEYSDELDNLINSSKAD